MSNSKTHKAVLSLEDKVTLFKKRFPAREDAFYEKKPMEIMEPNPETMEMEKKMSSKMFLVCGNFWDEKLCIIRTKNAKGCMGCTNRVNERLSDAYIKKHILGSKILCLIPLTPDGAKVGAIDFDRSIHDGLEHVFNDAKTVKDYCANLGIRSYLARSSNKGYHLYFFFEEWTEPKRVTSFLVWALRQTGFAARQETHGLALPEIFPKQVLYNSDTVGNGLRVPLSEPDVRQGKNCFVDDDRNPFPLDEQWQILENAELIKKSYFDTFIESNKIEIYDDGIGRGRKKKTVKKKERVIKDDGTIEEVEVEIDAPVKHEQFGSFNNIIAACPAMQEYWAKGSNGKYMWDMSNPKGLFHNARLASMTLALTTVDGEQTLKERWNNPKTAAYIEQAKGVGYSPVTCRWMQSCNVCRVNKHPKHGDHCYRKLPPFHMENGKLIENPDNLPEEEWSDVSPMRYRMENRMTVDEIKERFRLVVRGLNAQKQVDAGEVKIELNEAKQPMIDHALYTPDKAGDMLAGLMKKIAALKATEKDEITSFVLGQKWFTKTDWNTKMKAAGALAGEEKKKKVKDQYKTFSHAGKSYFLKDGKIISMFTDAKGVTYEQDFMNFWIERASEPAKIRLRLVGDKEEVTYEDRVYKLILHVGGQQKPITIPNKVFASASTFFSAIRTAGGTEVIFPTTKDAYDAIMTSISIFSDAQEEVHAVDEIGFYDFKSGTKYIMPSVIVSKEDIEKNTSYQIDMSDDYTKCLDFKILDTATFKMVSNHIINDYFHANNPTAMMAIFAHAMSAVCMKLVEEAAHYKKSPVLWWWGGYGAGKTWAAEQAQYFFGDFSQGSTVNATGSFKAKIGVAHNFRNAFIFFDDSKDSTQNDGGKSIRQFIQHAYDRSIMPALQRDGSLRQNTNRVRGMITVTAEDPIENEASAISRLIQMDAPASMRTDKGAKVMDLRKLYSGFTPYVVKHILNIDRDTAAQMWKTFYDLLFEGSANSSDNNASKRIAENLTMNYFGMQVALDTMIANGAITVETAAELSRQHLMNLKLIKTSMVSSVRTARGSHVFVAELKQLLADPVKHKIIGWKGTDIQLAERAEPLGFMLPKYPNVVFLYPKVAYKAVATAIRGKNQAVQSQTHIARQMVEDGYFVEEMIYRHDKRLTCRRSDPNKIAQEVYPIRADVLGLGEILEDELQVDSQPRKNVLSPEEEFQLQ